MAQIKVARVGLLISTKSFQVLGAGLILISIARSEYCIGMKRKRDAVLDGAFLDLVTALRGYTPPDGPTQELFNFLSRPVVAAVVADVLLELDGARSYSYTAVRIAARLQREAELRQSIKQSTLYAALARVSRDFVELEKHSRKGRKAEWVKDAKHNFWTHAACDLLEISRVFWEAKDGKVCPKFRNTRRRFERLLREPRKAPVAPTGLVVSRDSDRPVGEPTEIMLEASRRLNTTMFGVQETVLALQGRLLESQEPHPMKPWRPKFRKAERASVRLWNQAQDGKLHGFARAYWLAKEVQQERHWYASTYFDYRGRIYYRQDGLLPQGSDAAKALVVLKGPYRVQKGTEAWFELLAHLANKAGWSHLERPKKILQGQAVLQQWFQQGRPDDLSWASDPWQTYSALCELSWAENASSGLSRTLVQIDGRCNGLQLYASLLLDENLLRLTNVTGSQNHDLYADFGTHLEAFLETSELQEFIPDILNDPKRLRKLIKVPVMATPYGIGLIGIRDTLAFAGAKKNPKLLREVDYIAGCLRLAQEIVRVRREYLKGPLALMREIQELEEWKSPSGFLVTCRKDRKLKRWATSLVSRRSYPMVCPSGTMEVNRGEIAPNFMHSLDAAVAHRVAARMEGPLVAIHDCFATIPHAVPMLKNIIAEAFPQAVAEAARELRQRGLGKGLLAHPETIRSLVLGPYAFC